MKQVNKKAVGEMLEAWGKVMKKEAPLVKGTKDSLDIKALNEMEQTKALIFALKLIGVKDRKHLMNLGYFGAGMILIF